VKKALITPFLDLNLKTIDLGLANRQKTGNQIVDEAIKAIK
jgi:isocitrate dehydrogenase